MDLLYHINITHKQNYNIEEKSLCISNLHTTIIRIFRVYFHVLFQKFSELGRVI